jgi:hypothetical protein
MDIAKIDRDIAYIAMVVHVCCKLLFSMFHLFFSEVCCKCVLDVAYVFIHILQVFYLDVAYVLQWIQVFFWFFSSVLDACFKCFIIFRRMLHLLHLDISKLDRISPLVFYCLVSVSGVGSEGRQRRSPLARVVPMYMRGRTVACSMCSSSKWARSSSNSKWARSSSTRRQAQQVRRGRASAATRASGRRASVWTSRR